MWIAAAQPDIVIMPLNLASLGDPWRNRFSRPELAGWIRPRRLAEAFGLPIHWIGLTTDRLLYYVGIVQSGAFTVTTCWQELTHPLGSVTVMSIVSDVPVPAV